MGKNVIAIDLNPFSRTARAAKITIVDNVTRAMPLLIEYCKKLSTRQPSELAEIIRRFDNETNLKMMVKAIRDRLSALSFFEVV